MSCQDQDELTVGTLLCNSPNIPMQAGSHSRPEEPTYHPKAAYDHRSYEDMRIDRRAARTDGIATEWLSACRSGEVVFVLSRRET